MASAPIGRQGEGIGKQASPREVATIVTPATSHDHESGPVRRNQRAGPLIAAHDDFEQFLGRRDRQFAHAEIANNL